MTAIIQIQRALFNPSTKTHTTYKIESSKRTDRLGNNQFGLFKTKNAKKDAVIVPHTNKFGGKKQKKRTKKRLRIPYPL